MNYYRKYIKYKLKYINLKKKIYGGNPIKENTCTINKYKTITKDNYHIYDYEIWSAKKIDKSRSFIKVKLLNVVELKDIKKNDIIYIGEDCIFKNKLFKHKGEKIKLNLIGPKYVFQTNIDGREILLLGDEHGDLVYKKQHSLREPHHPLIDLYEDYSNEIINLSLHSD